MGLQTRALGFAGLLSLLAIALWFFLSTQETVTLVVGGETVLHRTHQTSVAGVLEELGVELGGRDVVLPGPSTPLSGVGQIEIRRAVDVTVEVDGRTLSVETLAPTVGEVFGEAGIVLGQADRVELEEGIVVSPELNLMELVRFGQPGASARPAGPGRVSLLVRRAVPVVITEGGVSVPVQTQAETVAEALRSVRIPFYPEDVVRPDPASPVYPGLTIQIERAIPLTLQSGGQRLETRVLGATVADALEAQGIALAGKDYTRPAPDTPLQEGLVIEVVRVTEEFKIESEAIPYETVWRPDPELELDHRRVVQAGGSGILRRLIRFVFEDGELVEQTVDREWVAEPPQDRVIAYGTKIVWRELESPHGTIRYWRHMRVFASSYTAATSGKNRDHPAYGITRVGWVATKGVIAVDPAVIPLLTRMYVPRYGFGTAADTGGAIKGRIIDLAYDEDKLVRWWQWTDAYLLGPVPPPDKIRWILPDWPPWG